MKFAVKCHTFSYSLKNMGVDVFLLRHLARTKSERCFPRKLLIYHVHYRRRYVSPALRRYFKKYCSHEHKHHTKQFTVPEVSRDREIVFFRCVSEENNDSA